LLDGEDLVEEALFSAPGVVEEEGRDEAEPEVVPEDDSDVVVGVDEADEGGAPADGGGDVEKGENADLQHDEPEENDVNELYHLD
jgi:hypothetical protein